MSLADRRTAALAELARQRPAGPHPWHAETKPSGDVPDDPWEAAAYFAERGYDLAGSLPLDQLLDGREEASP